MLDRNVRLKGKMDAPEHHRNGLSYFVTWKGQTPENLAETYRPAGVSVNLFGPGCPPVIDSYLLHNLNFPPFAVPRLNESQHNEKSCTSHDRHSTEKLRFPKDSMLQIQQRARNGVTD